MIVIVMNVTIFYNYWLIKKNSFMLVNSFYTLVPFVCDFFIRMNRIMLLMLCSTLTSTLFVMFYDFVPPKLDNGVPSNVMSLYFPFNHCSCSYNNIIEEERQQESAKMRQKYPNKLSLIDCN